MLTIEKLRSEQERRMRLALKPLEEANRNLKEAILLAEARQREFYDISDDVQRKIEALELVTTMNGEIDEEVLLTGRRLSIMQKRAAKILSAADCLQVA